MFDQARSLTLCYAGNERGLQFWPVEVVVTERYSDAGNIEIITLCSRCDLDPKKWVGARVQLCVSQQRQQNRYFSGYITALHTLNKLTYNLCYYHITVSSWLQYANISLYSRTFYHKNLFQILTSVLSEYQHKRVPSIIQYPKFMYYDDALPFQVQYKQTTLDFITELLHSLGMYYWVEYTKEGQILRFGPKTYLPSVEINPSLVAGSYPTMYIDASKPRRNWISAAAYNYKRVVPELLWPDGYAHRDPYVLATAEVQYRAIVTHVGQARYDYNHSDDVDYLRSAMRRVTDTGKAQSHLLTHYQYPNETSLLAHRQLQRQRHCQLQLRSHISAISLGQSLKLAGDVPDYFIDHSSIVPVKIIHRAKDRTGLPYAHLEASLSLLPKEWPSFDAHYENEIQALPIDLTPYQPPLSHQAKTPAGCLSAYIAGPRRGEVYTDKKGRVKVWFPWDQNNPSALDELCPWVRVKQAMSGQACGHQFIPRVGDEVSVQFVSGDMSEPLVVGSLYNERQPVPFDIAADPSLSAIKTPHHSMLISDKPKHEQFVLTTQGSLHEHVGADFDQSIVSSQTVRIKHGATVNVQQGSYSLTSNQSIRLNSGGGVIEITPNHVSLTGLSCTHTTLGSGSGAAVAVMGSSHSCPKHHASGKAHKGGPVLQGSPNVFINGLAVARCGDMVKCDDAKDIINQGHANFYVNGKPVACMGHASSHGGKLTSGSALVRAVHDPSLVPERSSFEHKYLIGVYFSFLNCPGQTVRARQFTLNYKTQEGSQEARSVDRDFIEQYTVVDDIYDGVLECALNPDPRQCDIISLNAIPQLPYYKAKIAISNMPNQQQDSVDKDHQYNLQLLWPMIIHDIRFEDEDTKKLDAQSKSYHKISSDDIAYLKANGNNVTVFVHGFNVHIGSFSEEIAAAEWIESAMSQVILGKDDISLSTDTHNGEPGAADGFALVRSSHDSTIYRDQNIIEQQCGKVIPAHIIKTHRDGSLYADGQNGNWKLNGTGARSWAIHMEHNLNVATGQFFPRIADTYKKYTRMVHVTWSGDPAHSIDYMDSVNHAFDSAPELADLIMLLKKQGLEVNVLAHSLGNAVLIKAMDLLTSQYAVDHAFLWEAAVPQDVFTRTKTQSMTKGLPDRWYMPHAINGAHKITVLHSQNDNILGPIPVTQPDGVSQARVNKAKPFFTELVPAYLTTALGLDSLYHFGMWIGMPISNMWQIKNQEIAYQQWRDELGPGPYPLADGSTLYLQPSLTEQVAHNPAEATKLYNQLEQKLKSQAGRLHKVFAAAGWADKSEWYKTWDNIAYYVTDEVLEHARAIFDIGVAVVEYAGFLVNRGVGAVEYHFMHQLTDETRQALMGAGCLLDIMLKLKIPPLKALGYGGPDKKTMKHYGTKINDVQQARWLWSHSGMKIPSKDLMQHVYKPSIWRATNYRFGNYSK